MGTGKLNDDEVFDDVIVIQAKSGAVVCSSDQCNSNNCIVVCRTLSISWRR